jgi:hypothetical protein
VRSAGAVAVLAVALAAAAPACADWANQGAVLTTIVANDLFFMLLRLSNEGPRVGFWPVLENFQLDLGIIGPNSFAMDWEKLIPGHPGQPGGRLGTKKDVQDLK